MSQYRILKKLSDKGELAGSVLLVELLGSKEKCVVKKIPHLNNPLHRAIFDKEINALNKLSSSPNIVKLLNYEYGKVAKTDVIEGRIILEYIDGKTLQEANCYIEGVAKRFQILQQLIVALRCAHDNGIIHRDVNPKNIMVTDDGKIKLIDFGICKIRGLIQKGTTFQFATNKYAAPEVGYHSENASERSDIFSLGAVCYFLFTNKEPVLPEKMEEAINQTSGIDVALRPILQKMTAVNPLQRYENIVDLEIDFYPIFKKYLDNGEKYLVSVPLEKFSYLRNNSLVITAKNNSQLLQEDIPNNFSNAFIRVEDKDGDTSFWFDGINYSMQCIFVDNYFQVISFRKLEIVYRERNKKLGLPVNGTLIFWNAINRIQNTYECFQLYNRILSHVTELRSKENVNIEYNNSYGIWKKFINAMIVSARVQAIKFNYDKYQSKNGFLAFTLQNDSCMGDESITRETTFAFETQGKNGTISMTEIGTFWGFEDDGGVMLIKPTVVQKKIRTIPKTGWFCVDYTKEISQYRRQQKALDEFIHDDLFTKGLKGIFAGVDLPTSRLQLMELRFFDEKLDIAQRRAVEKIVAAREIALIQGPPGTGKTNVLIEVLRQILYRNQRYPLSQEKILIVSQSHAAVDKIVEDLDPYTDKISVIRIGKDDNLSELARQKYSLDSQKEAWMKEIINQSSQELAEILASFAVNEDDFYTYAIAHENLHIEGTSQSDMEDYQEIINTFLRKYLIVNEDNILMKLLIHYQWVKHLNETNDLDEYFIKSATVVAGTCSGFISNSFVKNIVFDYVIVDEAAKATYPELLVPIVRAKKVVLVGDHKQLPPVFDREALQQSEEKLDIIQLQDAGFGKLFTTMDNSCKETLTTQYRMHPCIGSMISEIFYPDTPLQNGVKVEERTLDIPSLTGTAMLWISTSGLSLSQRKEEPVITHNGNVSYSNPQEAKVMIEYLQKLDSDIKGKKYSIGIITPYRAQLELIQRRIKGVVFNNLSLEVNTVDAFQGSQKDIIFYSTVRSSTESKIGFLSEQSRLNVSFSRAKSILVVVGDIDFLNNTSIRNNRFPEIIHYMKENSDYCKITNYGE